MNRLSLCERTIKAQHNHDSFSYLSPKYLLFVLVLKLEENSMHGSKILKREEKIGSRCTQLRTIRCGIWTVKINCDFWGSQGMRILVDTTLTTSNSLTAQPQKHPNSQYALPCLCLYKKCQNLQPIAPPRLFCTFRPRNAICHRCFARMKIVQTPFFFKFNLILCLYRGAPPFKIM
ncbi:hypothetical protein NC651_024930 [Populus alba x Populus x berolinensis]|nr:hypothetical protein NC651_024930 [Populus alba x Populus x berolinensis]